MGLEPSSVVRPSSIFLRRSSFGVQWRLRLDFKPEGSLSYGDHRVVFAAWNLDSRLYHPGTGEARGGVGSSIWDLQITSGSRGHRPDFQGTEYGSNEEKRCSSTRLIISSSLFKLTLSAAYLKNQGRLETPQLRAVGGFTLLPGNPSYFLDLEPHETPRDLDDDLFEERRPTRGRERDGKS